MSTILVAVFLLLKTATNIMVDHITEDLKHPILLVQMYFHILGIGQYDCCENIRGSKFFEAKDLVCADL